MRHILRQVYTDTIFNEVQGESHVQLMHRCRIISLACHYGHDRCTNKAQIVFRDWMRDKLNLYVLPNIEWFPLSDKLNCCCCCLQN